MDAASEPEGLATPDGAPPVARARRGTSVDARLVRRLLGILGNPAIEFLLLWTGERIAGPGNAPLVQLRIADRATLVGLVSDPRVRFGDAYSAGRIEVVGDLVQLLEIIYRSFPASTNAGSLARRIGRWLHKPRSNT